MQIMSLCASRLLSVGLQVYKAQVYRSAWVSLGGNLSGRGTHFEQTKLARRVKQCYRVCSTNLLKPPIS